MPIPDNSGIPLPKLRTRKRNAPPVTAVPSVAPWSANLPAVTTPPVGAAANTGSPVFDWMKSNRGTCWFVFWAGWFWLSPTTIIPGSVAVMVGYVYYRERTINLVSVCAAFLGILAYLALGGALKALPEQVNLWLGFGAIFALVVLGKRFPALGLFLIIMITSALSGGRGRRRW